MESFPIQSFILLVQVQMVAPLFTLATRRLRVLVTLLNHISGIRLLKYVTLYSSSLLGGEESFCV